LSSYPTPGVLKTAGEQIDYVSPHHYECENLTGTENDLNAVRAMIRKAALKRPVKVAVTEWNTTAGDWGPRRAKLWTLANALACSRYHNLIHRHCDLVDIANRSNLTTSFCSGIIQSDNHRLYKTPTYYAQQLYATLAGNRPLRIESPMPVSVSPDVSATLSADGKTVTLFAVNSGLHDVSRPLDLTAFGDAVREVEMWTLADRKKAEEPDVTNGFGDPERVAPVSSKLRTESGRFTYRFPGLSLSVLRWKSEK
jgi:alpha-L-arabinofuranosidase